MYVAVKGGEAAIRNAHRLLDDRRRGDRSVPALGLDQIVQQLALAVDRVMAEGSLYDRELAALAVKQACGDMIEAIFLVRAYRTTLPRFGYTRPVDTASMLVERRVSATYKDLPGAVFREGNLPKDNDTAVHAVDDIVLQAAGPGAEAFKGYMEQSDVYKILADAFALGTVQK